MRYHLFISEEAKHQLRELPGEIRRNIGNRLQLLQEDLAGDIKKLKVNETTIGCASDLTESSFA